MFFLIIILTFLLKLFLMLLLFLLLFLLMGITQICIGIICVFTAIVLVLFAVGVVFQLIFEERFIVINDFELVLIISCVRIMKVFLLKLRWLLGLLRFLGLVLILWWFLLLLVHLILLVIILLLVLVIIFGVGVLSLDVWWSV